MDEFLHKLVLTEIVKHLREQEVARLDADAELNGQLDRDHVSRVTEEYLLRVLLRLSPIIVQLTAHPVYIGVSQ